MRWTLLCLTIFIYSAAATEPEASVACRIDESKEYLNEFPPFLCGTNSTPLHLSPQSHVHKVKLTLTVWEEVDFFEAAIFEDRLMIDNVTEPKKEGRELVHTFTLSSKKYKSLSEYQDNVGDIIKEEHPEIYKELHEELQDAISGLRSDYLKKSFSKFKYDVAISDVWFDAQTPVFSHHPPAIFSEEQVLFMGNDASVTEDPSFLGLLSSDASSNLINLVYYNKEDDSDVKFPVIGVLKNKDELDMTSVNSCFVQSLVQNQFVDLTKPKLTQQEQVLDTLTNYELYLNKGGVHKLLVYTSYCYALADNNVNSKIEADLWFKLENVFANLECDVDYIPDPFMPMIADETKIPKRKKRSTDPKPAQENKPDKMIESKQRQKNRRKI